MCILEPIGESLSQIELEPKNATFRNNRGLAHFYTKSPEAALVDLGKVGVRGRPSLALSLPLDSMGGSKLNKTIPTGFFW